MSETKKPAEQNEQAEPNELEQSQQERAEQLKDRATAEADPDIEEGGPVREDVGGDQEVQDNAHNPDPEDAGHEHQDPAHTQEKADNEEAMRQAQKQGDEVPNPALTEKSK